MIISIHAYCIYLASFAMMTDVSEVVLGGTVMRGSSSSLLIATNALAYV